MDVSLFPQAIDRFPWSSGSEAFDNPIAEVNVEVERGGLDRSPGGGSGGPGDARLGRSLLKDRAKSLDPFFHGFARI